MKVLIIGSGAVGISIATALCHSDIETHMIVRSKAVADLMKTKGISRTGVLPNLSIPGEKLKLFQSVKDSEGGYDYIINCAKATGNSEIAEAVKAFGNGILNTEGIFIIFQNGFLNEENFLTLFPKSQIYHASFAIGFLRPEPNVSEVSVFAKPISIGSIFGESHERCDDLKLALDNGGLPCETSAEIIKIMWSKLIYNCTLNAFSSIIGVSYGGLFLCEASKRIMETLIDEIFEVMLKSGYSTFWDSAEKCKAAFLERTKSSFGHISSTLQDMRRKIPTEIDSLNGAVVKLGKTFGVETPYNEMLTGLIKTAEAAYNY